MVPDLTEALWQAVPAASRRWLKAATVHASLASTNSHLLGLPDPHGQAVIALIQTQGRGRAGRAWASQAGNLHLSLAWHYPQLPANWSALSLACGVALAEQLQGWQVPCHLKWPNDLLVHGAKLGGLLLESRVQGTAATVVLGVGLNRIPGAWPGATDLQSLGVHMPLPVLAGQVLGVLLEVCRSYPETGFAPYRRRWWALDAYAGRLVTLHTPQGAVQGLHVGVGGNGALRLEQPEGISEFHLGDLSLRPAANHGRLAG